jgi:hypothetical protein
LIKVSGGNVLAISPELGIPDIEEQTTKLCELPARDHSSTVPDEKSTACRNGLELPLLDMTDTRGTLLDAEGQYLIVLDAPTRFWHAMASVVKPRHQGRRVAPRILDNECEVSSERLSIPFELSPLVDYSSEAAGNHWPIEASA